MSVSVIGSVVFFRERKRKRTLNNQNQIIIDIKKMPLSWYRGGEGKQHWRYEIVKSQRQPYYEENHRGYEMVKGNQNRKCLIK